MNTKICFKCNLEKPITEFYVHKRMSDGHLGKCIECVKRDVKERDRFLRENDPDYIDKERKRGRDKYFRLNYVGKKCSKKTREKAQNNYRENFPEKNKPQVVHNT